jgi:hypothetical protein
MLIVDATLLFGLRLPPYGNLKFLGVVDDSTLDFASCSGTRKLA